MCFTILKKGAFTQSTILSTDYTPPFPFLSQGRGDSVTSFTLGQVKLFIGFIGKKTTSLSLIFDLFNKIDKNQK